MNDHTQQLLLRIAQYAATTTGAFLLNQRPDQLAHSAKSSATDVVTEMDHAAESLVVDLILRSRPDDAIVGEEGTARTGSTGVTWVIDPIDGSTNYLYDLPVWSVSVGVQVDGYPTIGVVEIPALGVSYWAVRGQGAWSASRAGVRSVTSNRITEVSQALVATGFGYREQTRQVQGNVLAQVLPQVRDIRRAGAASIDMCWVAEGLVDAYFEQGLHPWDYTAATVIAREAGAIVDGLWASEPGELMTFAAAPLVADELRSVLLSAYGTDL